MLHIVHTRGRRASATQPFGHVPIRVGSSPESDVELVEGAGGGIEPSHAEIRFEGGALSIVDLHTKSGTWVNGARVRVHPLKNGDVVALGGERGPAFRVDILGPIAASEDGKVDLATAARIVEEAVRRAEPQRDHKTSAIVERKVLTAQRRAARHNRLLSVGVVITLGAMLVAAWAVYKRKVAAAVLVTETGLGNAPVTAPTGSIPTRVLKGREIYEENRASLYVMGYLIGSTRIGGCCSAFAIAPNLLATNAHCVRACQKPGSTPIVTQNESGGKTRLTIVAMSIHPAYNPNSKSADTPDVGLLRVDGRMPKTVTLASDAELRAIGPGDDAFVLGFPGRVMDPVSPSATFLQGRVGRVMSLKEEATTPDKAVLLQHDAVTRGGNSGSPIFNQYGHVIGVHAAHIDEENDVAIGGKQTTVVQSSPFRLGMRIDLLSGVPKP